MHHRSIRANPTTHRIERPGFMHKRNLEPSAFLNNFEGSATHDSSIRTTLLPWITRIETAISALLAQPRYMKFNVAGLLRGDMKSRYESYAIGIKHQFIVPNEPRALEDMPPLPGGDTVVSIPIAGGSNNG